MYTNMIDTVMTTKYKIVKVGIILITISTFEFILLCLATFRFTRLIVFDSITIFLRKPFHEMIEETDEEGQVATYLHIKGDGLKYWIGELLSCYWCVGVWVSIFIVILYLNFPSIVGGVVLIFAIAGVASIIEMIVSRLVD